MSQPQPKIQALVGLPSPCISVCELDQATGLCLGCYRNRQEIKAWRDMDEAAQRQLLYTLHARRASLSGDMTRRRMRRAARQSLSPSPATQAKGGR